MTVVLIPSLTVRRMEIIKRWNPCACIKCSVEFKEKDRVIVYSRHGGNNPVRSKYYHEACYNKMFY